MAFNCAKVGTIRPCLLVSVLPVFRFSYMMSFSSFQTSSPPAPCLGLLLSKPRSASISLDHTASFPEVLVAAILVSPPNCLVAAFDSLLCFRRYQNPPQSVKIDLSGSPTSCGGHPGADGSRRGPKTCLSCSYNSLREGLCNGHSREVKEPQFWHAEVEKQCK